MTLSSTKSITTASSLPAFSLKKNTRVNLGSLHSKTFELVFDVRQVAMETRLRFAGQCLHNLKNRLRGKVRSSSWTYIYFPLKVGAGLDVLLGDIPSMQIHIPQRYCEG